MAEGPWPSRTGSSPAPVPDMPDPGGHEGPAARAGDAGYDGYAGGPDGSDYALAGALSGDQPDDVGRGRWDSGHRGRRLAAGGLAIALSSALAGGILGGWIATRPGSGTTPGYSLGTVPQGLTNRPATSVAGIAARVLPSVVMVRVNGGDGTGSGFVIRGGYIITNNHVVTLDGHSSHASIQIVFRNGASVPGRLVGRDTYSDIAVIRAAGVHHLPALTLGNSGGLDVGDPVIAFGAPLGLAGTVTSGIVSALDRPVQPGAGNGPAAPQVYLEAIQTDAPINPGNSGGPLVNGQGQVVGVNAAFDTLGGNVITGQGGSIGLGFAIPIDQVRRVATQIIRTGHATHSIIGALLNTSYSGFGAQIATAGGGTTPGSSAPGSSAPGSSAPGSTAPGRTGSSASKARSRAARPRAAASGTATAVPGRSGLARSGAGRPDATGSGSGGSGSRSPAGGRSGVRSGSVATRSGASGTGGGGTPPVTPGGPASAAGLRPGDVIVSFGGQPITNAQTLLDAIRADPPGARVRLTFLRGGQRHGVFLRLGSAAS
jgi:S1-C subfamily serine protease